MKKFFKRIALFFCATILVIFGCVACAPADTRTAKQKAWDELNSIGTGVFVEGTAGGKYAFNDRATSRKIEITVNEYENVVINILEGTSAGRTVTVLRWTQTSSTTGIMVFDLTGDTIEFNELVVAKTTFWLE